MALLLGFKKILPGIYIPSLKLDTTEHGYDYRELPWDLKLVDWIMYLSIQGYKGELTSWYLQTAPQL